MQNFYNEYGEIYYINTANANMEVHYEPFLERLQQGACILDAGCGSGRDAFAFKNMGYKVEAMDASEKMVFLSTHLLEQEVYHLRFQEMDFEKVFDGIWACASLLHVPTSELPLVFKNMNRALKTNGILLASFKYGTFEGERFERYFNDFDEAKFEDLKCERYGFEILNMWKTEDVREEREGEFWLNVLLKTKKD